MAITEKELKKLKRLELLELMVMQGREIDRLKEALNEANGKLEDRRLTVEKSGTLAEASIALCRVLDKTQEAADLYLENVRLSADEEAGRIVKQAREEAQRILAEAREESKKIRSFAGNEAGNLRLRNNSGEEARR